MEDGMEQGWLKEGIKEIKKELRDWPEWKRTTTVQQTRTDTKQGSPSENNQSLSTAKKK